MILTLQTTTFGAFGGIPTYNRLVCRVLNETSTGRVLIGTDRPSDLGPAQQELRNLKLEAFANNRLALARRFLHLALTEKVELLLIGHVNYAPLGWLVKRLRPKVKLAVMLYGIEAWEELPALKKRALKNSDFLIAISEFTRQSVARANSLEPDRVYVLPNALEWTREHNASELTPSANGSTRLLSVCRLDEAEKYKGVDTVIEALPEVLKKVANVEYTVVGDGTDLPRHKELAARLGVLERVHFSGYLADKELRECYQKCDLFVMPSGGEGFGFVFLEAMKFRKPVIAADSGGAPEVVQHGTTGALIQYGDKAELAKVIVELSEDRKRREELGAAGYRSLQEKFTYEHFKERLTQILSRELAPASRGELEQMSRCAS